jgi:hypothetical protein
MIGFPLAMGCFFAGLLVWAAGIRPDLSRQGRAGATGPTWCVSAWADWHQCSELARAGNDPRARALSQCFLPAPSGILIGIILTPFRL